MKEPTHRYTPLVGESPLVAAYGDLALVQQMRDQQQNFLQNRAAPSAVLSTDLTLSPAQVQQLRDRRNDASKGLHAGGVPILTHGLKVTPWLQPAVAKDMQLAELLKLTRDQIALVFRMPLAILGVAQASGSTTEQLYAAWLASGLGFCLNHLEEAFGNLFGSKGQPDDYCEFDTSALLRSAQKDRIEMLVRAVQGGIMSPNEAREAEGLPAVAFGGEPRLQAQVVPLSSAAMIPAAPAAPAGGDAHARPPSRQWRTQRCRRPRRACHQSERIAAADVEQIVSQWETSPGGRRNAVDP